MTKKPSQDEWDRPTGRPRRADAPELPWDELDRLLVLGELRPGPNGTAARLAYPSYRALAERYGVSHTVVARYAKDHNCLARRKLASATDERRPARAGARTRDPELSREGLVRILSQFIRAFEGALEEGRVRCDNASDFLQVLRAYSQWEGEGAGADDLPYGLPSLEELEARHARMLQNWAQCPPAVRGELPMSVVTGWPDRQGEGEAEPPQQGSDCTAAISSSTDG